MNPSDPITVWLEPKKSVEGRFECELDNGRILVNIPKLSVTSTPTDPIYTEIGRRDAEFKYIDEKWQLMCYRRQAA